MYPDSAVVVIVFCSLIIGFCAGYDWAKHGNPFTKKE